MSTKLDFYTNFLIRGNKVFVRGYSAHHSEPVFEEHEPDLTVYTTKPTMGGSGLSQFKTLKDEPLHRINFDNVADRRTFVKDSPDVLYGPSRLEYATVSDLFPSGVKLSNEMRSKIRIAYIDIEVESEQCFAKPENPVERVNAVTVVYKDTAYCMSTLDHTPDEKTQFLKCQDEYTLFEQLKKLFRLIKPDVLSGWYADIYDMPYLIERAKVIYGDDSWGRAISPWGYVIEEENHIMGKKVMQVEIAGITILDYKDLYTQYGKKQPSYKLKHVAQDELGETKVDYDGSLRDFYKNAPSEFIRYNIQDARLIQKMDNKLHYFVLVFMLAYRSRCRYRDVFAQVRMWEMKIFDELHHRYKVMPHIKKGYGQSEDPFEGAYVHDPVPGMYKKVATFDLTALYPSILMLLNISPETLEDKTECSVDDFMKKNANFRVLNAEVKERNCTLAVNGAMFSKKKIGFIPVMLQEIFDERAEVKKQLLETERQIEVAKVQGNKALLVDLEDSRIMFDNVQNALKISSNSCYGALGSTAFLYFNRDIAEAVTISGQFTVLNVSVALEEYIRKIIGNPAAIVRIYNDTDSCRGDSIVVIDGSPIKISDYYDSCKATLFSDKEKTFKLGEKTALAFDGESKINAPIKYVMKHKVKKKMYKVSVGERSVFITEDHSLIVIREGEMIMCKPTEIQQGDMLIQDS